VLWGTLKRGGGLIGQFAEKAGNLIKDDDVGDWSGCRVYAANAATALAYSFDLWQGGDPRCGVWAARQVLDTAYYAAEWAQDVVNGIDRSAPHGMLASQAAEFQQLLDSHEFVARAIAWIDWLLSHLEVGGDLAVLAARSHAEGERWIAEFPPFCWGNPPDGNSFTMVSP
jgi:hypothetical protein